MAILIFSGAILLQFVSILYAAGAMDVCAYGLSLEWRVAPKTGSALQMQARRILQRPVSQSSVLNRRTGEQWTKCIRSADPLLR